MLAISYFLLASGMVASTTGGESEKLPVHLGPVQTTLLIPLVGRAKETLKENGMISDPKAVEIYESLDFDFSIWENSSDISGAVVRTLIMDEDVNLFLEKHPTGTVVEIGCGLNTRYERLDNGQATWLELDLPDSMALRQKFFDETPRRHMIAASILDFESWIPQVRKVAPNGPWCFVSEAVIIYLEQPQVKSVIVTIADEFQDSWFVLDTTSAKTVGGQAKSPLIKHLPKNSWFRWECEDPKTDIESWTGGKLKLLRQRGFSDAPTHVTDRAPNPYWFFAKYLPFMIRLLTGGYNLNVFVPKKDLPIERAEEL